MHRLLGRVLLMLLAVSGAQAADDLEIEGLYEILDSPVQGAAGEGGNIRVLEFFWYRCPHCNAFHPFVESYLAAKPAHVEFRRVPAVLRDSWIPYAKIYLVSEALGLTEQLHARVFAAIHGEGRRLGSRASIRAFFVANGVSAEAFDQAFDSSAVERQLERSHQLSVALGVDGVPTVVIDGRYRSSGALAGSYENLVRVVEALVERARAEKQ